MYHRDAFFIEGDDVMDISPIGNGNYYITISGEEMRGSDVTELVRKNISPFSEDAFLEIFPGADGALVFARVRRGSPIVFSFFEIETVISAVELCATDCVAFLAYDADEYKLIYHPWDDEPAPAALYEFCTSAEIVHPDYQKHMEEQGLLLLGPCAIDQLKELFT